jgi:hypothetical protein
MKRDESVSVAILIILGFVLVLGVYEGFWSLGEVLSLVPYFIMAGMVGVVVWGFRERIENALRGTRSTDSDAGKIMLERLGRIQDEPRLDRLRDRMECVYGPLHSAVTSLKEGKEALPGGYTVGTPINAWTKYPEIMKSVIDIFSKYPNLVENERVWKGWTKKEHELRDKKFWLGKEVYEWFDAIEEEYNRIDSELKPEPVRRDYDFATLTFRIWSTTDWAEIGLLNSKHVELVNYRIDKGTVRTMNDPNTSHLRIDTPAFEMHEISATATFQVYPYVLFVFTRKGDYGTLKVRVFDKHGRKLCEVSEYGTTEGKYNYLEQDGFEPYEWD